MRIPTLFLTAIAAASSLQALAIPEAHPGINPVASSDDENEYEIDDTHNYSFCGRRGQGCMKLKQRDIDDYCHRPGKPCNKVKRAAEAYAEAFIDEETIDRAIERNGAKLPQIPDLDGGREYSLKDPHRGNFCFRRGQGCFKLKRAIEAVDEALEDKPEDETSSEISQTDKEARDAANNWCYRRGQGCLLATRDIENLKRATTEASKALDSAEDQPSAVQDAIVKYGLEVLDKAMAKDN